ncbi:hypothetical protein PATA110616_05480 [Paenibacillus tarimensis]
MRFTNGMEAMMNNRPRMAQPHISSRGLLAATDNRIG